MRMALLVFLALGVSLALTPIAHAEPVLGEHISLSRTHAHSGATRLELACPQKASSSCEARRYVNGEVVAENKVTRAKGEQIFSDFMVAGVNPTISQGGTGQFVHWDVTHGAQHASGGIERTEKLARPVVSLEAELLALVRKR
ncbi:MAG: hypothetical protein HY074_11775 [Deltaproteobacteria bacterium]|nr:hypothetical protein [Deltaproteobacteria bacterium]